MFECRNTCCGLTCSAEDESGKVHQNGRVLVAAVVKFSEAGLSWGTGENQQQLSVILMQGAPSCLSDHIFPAFPFIPSVSFSRQLLNCRSIDCASKLVRVFHQLVSLPFAAEVPAVLSLLFRWLKAHKKPLRADVKYPLIL